MALGVKLVAMATKLLKAFPKHAVALCAGCRRFSGAGGRRSVAVLTVRCSDLLDIMREDRKNEWAAAPTTLPRRAI